MSAFGILTYLQRNCTLFMCLNAIYQSVEFEETYSMAKVQPCKQNLQCFYELQSLTNISMSEIEIRGHATERTHSA